jgi:hypothetical protein
MRRFLIPFLTLSAAFVGAAAFGGVPTHVSTRLKEPLGRGIRASETIRIVTQWDGPGFTITPDFSSLDGGHGGTAAVYDSANGSYLITYTTGSMDGLARSTGIEIPITAQNGDGAFTANTLRVCRNLGNVPQLDSSWVSIPRAAYRPGDALVVETLWDTSGVVGFRPVPDFTSIAPGFRATSARVSNPTAVGPKKVQYEISYTIPPAIQLAPGGNRIPLWIIGQDGFCSEVRTEGPYINLRSGGPPVPSAHRLIRPESSLPNSDPRRVRYEAVHHDGERIRVFTRWDSTAYRVKADFSALDESTEQEDAVPDTAKGAFTIDHIVGTMRPDLPDDSVSIAITAYNQLGDSATDRTFLVRRNRYAPRPVVSMCVFVGDSCDSRLRFKSNDSLNVMVRWEPHPLQLLPIEVIPIFQNLIPSFDPSHTKIVSRGADSSLILYRIPDKSKEGNVFASDGDSIPIIVIARDALWGMADPETILVALDTTAPLEPVLDTPAAETNEPRIRITGRAPEAARIGIRRQIPNDDLRMIGYVSPLDSAGTFEVTVDLAPGRNRIQAFSEDEIGNRSASGGSVIVYYVAQMRTIYPTPYRIQDEITVHESAGMREARVEIYNLEGERIVEMSETGAFLLTARFHWDGRDSHGDRAQPGYYLMRIRRILTTGRSTEEVVPMLFRND